MTCCKSGNPPAYKATMPSSSRYAPAALSNGLPGPPRTGDEVFDRRVPRIWRVQGGQNGGRYLVLKPGVTTAGSFHPHSVNDLDDMCLWREYFP